MQIRDSRFNTPAEMWVRFVYASRLLFFLAGLVLGAIALTEGSVLSGIEALISFGVMVAGHQWLKRGGHLERCDRAFDTMFSGDTVADELDALLQRRAALEEKRGTSAFDPWAMQAVRREISAYVRQHPESSEHLEG